MFPGFEEQLCRYSEVIVRVGLNLRRGQRVLIADPYTLQGVTRAAAPLVEAVESAARAAGASGVEVMWGDEELWRAAAAKWPHAPFVEAVAQNTRRISEFVARGDALVLLESVNPGLGAGLSDLSVAALRRHCAQAYATYAPALLAGATNWTAAPAPSPVWADVVFADLPAGDRIGALWSAVFAACRCVEADPLEAWRVHLDDLESRRERFERRRLAGVQLRGPGTELKLDLHPAHRWCTAVLSSRDGRCFVPNLPTDEIFTAPHPGSANGRLRVARPVSYGGAVIDGIELGFRSGLVVEARARRGGALLARLLASDPGAMRLGEVAWVAPETAVARTGRVFHSALLDENALPHLALGDAYEFTASGRPVNHSLLHLDLPVEAEISLFP